MGLDIMNMVGTASCDKQNIYIASLPRSGSTLLGMILNQHPSCFNIGESFYWAKLNPANATCTCGLKECPILKHAYEKIKKIPDILSITDTITEIDSILQTGDVISRKQITKVYSEDIIRSCNGFNYLTNIFRKITNRNIIIDSSANAVIALNLIKHKNWKIIILIRDPRGIICSLKKAAIRHRENIPNDLWRGYVVDFFKSVNIFYGMDNVILVRYEELCNDPTDTISRICNFLKITFNAGMLKYRQDKGHVLMANRMRFGEEDNITQDNSWKNYLSEEEKKIIHNDTELINVCKKYKY